MNTLFFLVGIKLLEIIGAVDTFILAMILYIGPTETIANLCLVLNAFHGSCPSWFDKSNGNAFVIAVVSSCVFLWLGELSWRLYQDCKTKKIPLKFVVTKKRFAFVLMGAAILLNIIRWRFPIIKINQYRAIYDNGSRSQKEAELRKTKRKRKPVKHRVKSNAGDVQFGNLADLYNEGIGKRNGCIKLEEDASLEIGIDNWAMRVKDVLYTINKYYAVHFGAIIVPDNVHFAVGSTPLPKVNNHFANYMTSHLEYLDEILKKLNEKR